MKKRHFICVAMLTLLSAGTWAADFQLKSPNQKLVVTVQTGDDLTWAINHESTTVLIPSEIKVECKVGNKEVTMGGKMKGVKVMRGTVNNTWHTAFYRKNTVEDNYNYLTLKAKGYRIEFRAYDEGAAYRIVSTLNKPFVVEEEDAEFRFAGDYKATVAYCTDNDDPYHTSYESYYKEPKLSEFSDEMISIQPMVVYLPGGKKAMIMDAGLLNYPSMFIKKGDKNAVEASFDKVAKDVVIDGNDLVAVSKYDYIATFKAQKEVAMPWRCVVVSEKDADLLDVDMAMNLSPECKIADTSWIKPGKVAWDWYNYWNIYGVDFAAGINTETYKYYIDFASANKIEYVILDEGWSSKESLTKNLNPDVDLPELIRYGKEKGVGIILWSLWRNLKQDIEGNFAHYEKMGVKGFKIDFFNRGDQEVFLSTEEIAASAAKHHMLVDFHGHRAFGLNRPYPNVVNFEGVRGLENCKWLGDKDGVCEEDFPRYDVLITMLRMQAGPMDYTPGAMLNSTKNNFHANFQRPMSVGTRVHQLAMYPIYEAPLQMLADSPSNYLKEQECTDFIAKFPTTFDKTVVLDAVYGEYVAVARQKDGVWYVGVLNNWTERDVTLDLSKLGMSTANADIFSDGPNAKRVACDYKHTVKTVNCNEKLPVHLAPGGGWAAILK